MGFSVSAGFPDLHRCPPSPAPRCSRGLLRLAPRPHPELASLISAAGNGREDLPALEGPEGVLVLTGAKEAEAPGRRPVFLTHPDPHLTFFKGRREMILRGKADFSDNRNGDFPNQSGRCYCSPRSQTAGKGQGERRAGRGWDAGQGESAGAQRKSVTVLLSSRCKDVSRFPKVFGVSLKAGETRERQGTVSGTDPAVPTQDLSRIKTCSRPSDEPLWTLTA